MCHHKSMIPPCCSHQTHPCKPINPFCQEKRSSLHICHSQEATITVLSQTVYGWRQPAALEQIKPNQLRAALSRDCRDRVVHRLMQREFPYSL